MTANMSPSCPFDADFDERDVTAIDKLLRNVGECFAAGDMESWSALFAEKADFVGGNGLWWTSRAAIEKGHGSLACHRRAHRPSYMFKPLKWEALSPTVAVAHGQWDWTGFPAGDGLGDDQTGVLTLILLRIAGCWKIRAAHNLRTELCAAFG